MATLISFPMARSLGQDVETPSPEWITRFVDDIPTGVAVFDRELNYVAANPAWLDAFGLGIRPLEGQRHDALDPVSGAQIGELQRRALCGQVVEGCNTVERDAAGRLHHRAISARPRIGTDGSIVGVIAALHDIVAAASSHTATLWLASRASPWGIRPNRSLLNNLPWPPRVSRGDCCLRLLQQLL